MRSWGGGRGAAKFKEPAQLGTIACLQAAAAAAQRGWWDGRASCSTARLSASSGGVLPRLAEALQADDALYEGLVVVHLRTVFRSCPAHESGICVVLVCMSFSRAREGPHRLCLH
mmetsp:Transcript_71/g.147  ORF Transcript_71/g.147 Transcript_71/m.147 type:complete len:115 (+) Transcript_71:132-476(+)